MTELRPELEPLPERMTRLVVHRGYPVPWFVQWVCETDRAGIVAAPTGVGEPRFEIMDRDKHTRAVRDGLCWVCGQVLGSYRSFVIGPMCAVNRTSAEPPCHLDCAEWSARNCPFLSRPTMSRRVGCKIEGTVAAPGVALMRNPGVAMVWTTRRGRYGIRRVGDGILFNIGEPEHVSCWAEGRPATQAEIERSIETGLPALMELAEEEGAMAVAELQNYVKRASLLLRA